MNLPVGYTPSPAEVFMNARQPEYFRQKLLGLLQKTRLELDDVGSIVAAGDDRLGDQADQASASEDRTFGLINRAREKSRLKQIERALVRIENNTYGYCQDTGDAIDLRRLEVQPTATNAAC